MSDISNLGNKEIFAKNLSYYLKLNENEAPIVNYFLDTYEKYHSLRKASIYTNEKLNLTKHWRNYAKIINQTMYYGLTRENKQVFWRNIIDKIEIDPSNYKKGMKYIKIFFV